MVSAAADALVVAAFALQGRRSHDEAMTLAGWWETAWPFLAGLALGWLGVAAAFRRAPTSVVLGLPVWVATVFGGMALRDMSGQGTALAFVLVATGTLALGLIGWRVVAALLRRGRPGRSAQAPSSPVRETRSPRADEDEVPDPIGTRELSDDHDDQPGRGVVPPEERSRLARRASRTDPDSD